MSQPTTLQSGIWADLFPKALTVIDEIRKHGGVPDPFFTFGGGTVLFLRYDHRLSKDIDIFVPDPQSLNYVTPRLSDVADDVCNSQYVEAQGYVKLNLPLGEIDFVAAANLLPNEHAFEQWNIFGHSIRVETAAEIVAKKMYHRGDKATARDLFDLAMVVEREPNALKHAEPFFYRHAETFIANVRGAKAGYVGQFNDIEQRSYNPTFEHAADVALTYLGSLQKALTASEHEARQAVGSAGQTLVEVDNQNGKYVGPIVAATSHHLVQQIGRNNVVIHERHKLPFGTGLSPNGESTDLYYSHGSATTRRTKQTSLER